MLLEIIHDTTYKYEPSVEIAQHLLHLKPQNTSTQIVLKTDLRISPTTSWTEERTDVYGNISNYLSLENRHQELSISVNSIIKTIKYSGPILAPDKTKNWENVREYFRYHSNTQWDSASEYLFNSPFITTSHKFQEFARLTFTGNKPILKAAIELMTFIYKEFKYVSKSTDINTPALIALENKEGVCQDFAHILITSLRSLGLPAKYISGYILSTPPPGKERLIGSDASHAWVSIYIPELDENGKLTNGLWCDLDPTNNRWGFGSPGEDYVFLAQGRDYSDVSPVKGVIHGGADHQLDVAVTVRPVTQLI